MNSASVLETRSRKRRVTATQRRRTSERHSRGATQLSRPHLAWYAGLAVMATIEVIEWPLVIMMILGHEIAHRANSEALRDFAEGIQAGV